MILNALSILLVLAGLFFLTASAVGALRLPDFYTRAHALGMTDSLGTLFVLLGLAVPLGFSIEAGKLVLLTVFIFIATPTACHVFVRAALRSGLKPWTKETKDGTHD